MHFDVLFSPGMPRMRTVGEPGTQGAGTTGTQGIGCKCFAAIVAARTVGLAIDLHIPNGGIFMTGT